MILFFFFFRGIILDKDIFQSYLDLAGLSKKDYSDISGIPYPTIRGWGSTTPFPPYLDFMLKNYIDACKFRKIAELLKNEI